MNMRIFLTAALVVILACVGAWMLTGCTTISLTCPDQKSTLTYRGTNLLSPATTAASCTNSGSGPMASITGTDLSQLEGMVLNGLIASGQIPAPVAKPTAIPAPTAKPTP